MPSLNRLSRAALVIGAALSSAPALADQTPAVRSRIIVGCGSLSDSHGAQVQSGGAAANSAGSARPGCASPRAPEPPAPAPVAEPAPVPEPQPVVAAPAEPVVAARVIAAPPKPKAAPKPTAPKRQAAAPVPEKVEIAADWHGHQEKRLEELEPTIIERQSAAIMSGGLLWLLHSSFWASLLVIGLPMWRHVDLLAIVSRGPADDGEAQDEAATEEQLAGAVLAHAGSANPNRSNPS